MELTSKAPTGSPSSSRAGSPQSLRTQRLQTLTLQGLGRHQVRGVSGSFGGVSLLQSWRVTLLISVCSKKKKNKERTGYSSGKQRNCMCERRSREVGITTTPTSWRRPQEHSTENSLNDGKELSPQEMKEVFIKHKCNFKKLRSR